MKLTNLVFGLACVILVVNINGFKTKNRGRKVEGKTLSYFASVSFLSFVHCFNTIKTIFFLIKTYNVTKLFVA